MRLAGSEKRTEAMSATPANLTRKKAVQSAFEEQGEVVEERVETDLRRIDRKVFSLDESS